mgnify:CR=1 FL=1
MRGAHAAFGRLSAPLRMGSIALILFACGCYRQQMARQPGYHNPDQPSEFFADGQANRPLVSGTVARGQLRDDNAYFTGRSGDAFTNDFPLPLSMAVLERGRERFDIYCSICHGRVGRGDGQVVQRGYIKPPSFHSERLRAMPVGQMFDVVTRGFGAMPDYASQIPVNDRWAIIAYVRALQFSQNVPTANLTPEDQRRLEEAQRGR